MNPEALKIAHIAAVLAAHITTPDPETEGHERNMVLSRIAADGNAAPVMVGAVAHCGWLLAAATPEGDVDAAVGALSSLPSGSVGFELGVGFARRALAGGESAAGEAASFVSQLVVELSEGDEERMGVLLGEAMGVALVVFQAFASPW